ncbi:hypothetical protein JKF63_06662 [Porcisia hertigi]|uniref:Uncharacterized protein n=1 Tax=Porcisia hertigi TaxID=2761500 RepID=A0A836I0X5_9TRYP|nr:hypothetical protein JKF63_06662 [Porcisia hertigi]
MPQLQQLSSHCAAESACKMRKHRDAPRLSTASSRLLPPPVPRAVLFNTAAGFAYQVMTTAFEGSGAPAVCIFTVRRIRVPSSGVLSQHIAAAVSCRLPFCVVKGGVTWSDVVATLILSQPVRTPSQVGWNVQVLGQDVTSGFWYPITPSLSSLLETRYFLCTDVEVLFGHYQTSTLYMKAVPLTPETLGPDWRTPLMRNSATWTTSPPAPIKAPRQWSTPAPSRSTPKMPATTGIQTAPAPSTGEARPRSLTAVFDLAAQTPSTPPLDLPPPAMWSLAAFVKHQERWVTRCQELRQRTASLTPREALQQVREELRLCCAAFDAAGCVSPVFAAKGLATWALSLLEHQCAILADDVYASCTDGRNDHRFRFRLACRRLGQAYALSCKVIDVADSVLSAAGVADDAGAVLPDFPRDWLALLLASLRLRSLRHLALAHACGVVSKVPQQSAWSMKVLVEEAVQTVGWILEALSSICEREPVPGLARAALGETLLTCILSLAELAAYLSTNTSRRCQLMAAAVHICRVRFQLAHGGGEVLWVPRCVCDVVARMQSKFDRIPLTSSAFADYARLIELLQNFAQSVEKCKKGAASHTAATPTAGQSEPQPLGYTVTYLPVTAAADAAFLRGNTLVRELRRTSAAVQRSVPRSLNSPSLRKQSPQSSHCRTVWEGTEPCRARTSPPASETV